ncbi:MAG TPA: CAP domain-containing protein [Dehalococcoidia bacterium]|nr:CAP domain-containing protein [Dehalococcoidia bacterium]
MLRPARVLPHAARLLVPVLIVGLFASALHPNGVTAAGGCALTRSSLTPDTEEQNMLNLINSYRGSEGLAALTLSPTLMAAAAWKSQDLASNHYFAHDDATRSWSQRLVDCGYTFSANVAENLAAGNATATLTLEQWRTSAAHNANLLNPAMKAIGVARAYVDGSPYGWYWTADFGAVLDAPAAAPPASPPNGPPTPPGPALPANAPAGPAPSSAASPSALSVNATALVAGTGDCLRVHAAPSLASNVVACLPDGSGMVIADGPVGADGYTWWKLGALGWAVDQYLTAAR